MMCLLSHKSQNIAQHRAAGVCCWAASMLVLAISAVSAGMCLAQTSQAGSEKEQHGIAAGDDLERARRVLASSQWKGAEGIVRGYLKQNPESADAHALMGLILYRLHQPRASMAEFITASQKADLSAFDLRIFALDCAAIPDFPEAEKWLVRSIAKDDHDAASWEALGHVRFAQQHYQDAIDALEHALPLAPNSVSTETLIGLSQERLAHLDAAQAAYRQAIEWQADRKTKDSVPLVGMGRVLLANNQTADAIQWLQQATANPDAPSEAHELLGLAYQKSERPDDAVQELRTAIELDPTNARLHLILARAYRAMGDTDKAAYEQAEYARLKENSAP